MREVDFAKAISNLKAKSNDTFVFASENGSNVNLVCLLANIDSGTDRYTEILESDLRTSSPVQLMIAMPFEKNAVEQNFISHHRAEKISQSGSTELYRISLPDE